MKINHVLVDYENDPVKPLALLQGEQFKVMLFLGQHNTRLPIDLVLAMQAMGDRAKYVVLETPGKNALDFHLAYYLGVLAAQDPGAFYHIISKDTGFDPLIKHLKARNILCSRSATIEEMPCFHRAPVAAKHPTADVKDVKPNPAPHPRLDEMVNTAVSDLVNRKAAKPRTPKTVRSTMQATLQTKYGKSLPEAEIDAVYETLVKQGHVIINGRKISYVLPAS